VVAQTKLAKQLTGWASVGAGNKLISADIGIGYAATKNLDVNLSYDYSKYNSITSYAGQDYDITTKGLHLGLTFNF